MFSRKDLIDRKFKNVYIVDNRNRWTNFALIFNPETDIVFCIDFGLKNELEKSGFQVFYLDHIVEPSILQDANYQMHYFLDNWFKNDLGEDLLVYKGLKLGDALLLNLITDTTSFCHFFFNAIAIKKLNYETLILGIKDDLVHRVFEKLNLKYTNANVLENKSNLQEYVFPISIWVNSRLYKQSLKQKIIGLLKNTLTSIQAIIDATKESKNNLYIQEYHPTEEIITKLINRKDIVVRTTDYTLKRSLLNQRRIPKSFPKKSDNENKHLLNVYINANKQNWCFEGYNLSAFLYEILTPIVRSKINEAINTADTIIRHFEKNNYLIVIPVTNYWLENRLIMNYAKNKNIPVFMIANGLLNMSFENDGRDSEYINCYSETVKEDYFNNSKNAFCLGDPRMDKYSFEPKKEINYENPVIIIGAAGFNSIDLNSYLAYEFDFLYDILYALNKVRQNGLNYKIILKVRDNGYAYQYQNFVNEYFDDLNIEIIQNVPFYTLIKQADLYISIYSQTLFEASCLGIPVIYYKKDTQFINRPFNSQNELVTASNPEEIEEKILAFYADSDIFNVFKERLVLEKYIGPLDGNNVQRNIDFINSILKQQITKHG